MLHVTNYHVAGDVGCKKGGCLGERIYFNGKWPTLADCHNSGGKCCAQNVDGSAPWTIPNWSSDSMTSNHPSSDCWYCFTEKGDPAGHTDKLPKLKG